MIPETTICSQRASSSDGAVRYNPFATKWTRPGALPFIFRSGATGPQLIDRLRNLNWQGQILGPHGSGKSTLLHTLIPRIEKAGKRVLWCTLKSQRRNLRSVFDSALVSQAACTVVVIDGFEQVPFPARWLLTYWTRLRHAGLLVTTHRDVGLPTIHRTAPDVIIAQRLVQRLLCGGARRISEHDVAGSFSETNGDMRELLFRLYDLYERRRQSARGQ